MKLYAWGRQARLAPVPRSGSGTAVCYCWGLVAPAGRAPPHAFAEPVVDPALHQRWRCQLKHVPTVAPIVAPALAVAALALPVRARLLLRAAMTA